MERLTKLLMLLAIILFAACTDNNDNPGGHPLLIVRLEDRAAYIAALKQIRTEGTDEHLIAFFFRTAISRMKGELSQKHKNSLPLMFF